MVEYLAPLPEQGLLVLVVSVRLSLVLKLYELLWAEHLKFLRVLKHGRGLSDVFGVKVTFEQARDMWGNLSLLNHSLPANVSTPGVGLDPSDLPLSDAASRVLMQHQLE